MAVDALGSARPCGPDARAGQALADNPNLAARLAERALRHPDRLAIAEWRGPRVRRRTFAELARSVKGLAAGLTARGLKPGERVLVFVPMSLDLYILLLAIHHAGACAVFVDAWADRRRLDAAVRAAAPRMFAGSARAQLLRLMSPAVRAIPHAVIAGGAFPVERLARAGPAQPAIVGEDDPALVTFTTGSTGVPKAAVRSHGFLWAQHMALMRHLGLGESDVDLPSLPVFVLNNLAGGVPSVLPDFDPRRPDRIDPARIVAQMEAERVTTTSGSPAFFEHLAQWSCRNGRKIPVRALFTGGAPVLPLLAAQLAESVDGEAHIVYGSTEAEPIAGIETRAMLEAMAGRAREGLCVGAPVPEITLRLIRPHDGPVVLDERGWEPWDLETCGSHEARINHEVGEIVVAGSHVLGGYLNDPEGDRANKIDDGTRRWHRTGDAAWRDEQGRLWLMGRVKRRVRRDGHTWWGLPAELRALRVANVRHAAYLSAPDPALGERAVLCVESESASETLKPLLELALAPMPLDELHVLAAIPRDPRHRSKTDWEALQRVLAGRSTG